MFRRSLPRPRTNVGTQVELHVNRRDVMETSFTAIMSIRDPEILKTRFEDSCFSKYDYVLFI